MSECAIRRQVLLRAVQAAREWLTHCQATYGRDHRTTTVARLDLEAAQDHLLNLPECGE